MLHSVSGRRKRAKKAGGGHALANLPDGIEQAVRREELALARVKLSAQAQNEMAARCIARTAAYENIWFMAQPRQ